MANLDILLHVFKQIGLDIPRLVTNFENRLKLQKLVYLLEEFGYDLDYDYNWYKFGPYSPSLTRDACMIQDNKMVDASDSCSVVIDDVSLKIINKLNRFVKEMHSIRRQLDESSILELVTSIVYLNRHVPYSIEQLRRVLPNRKSKFNPLPREFEPLIELLTHHDLIS